MGKLIYVLDAVGEYTIAEEGETSVTLVGQVDEESYAKLFCASPELLEQLKYTVRELESWINNEIGGTYLHKEALLSLDKAKQAIFKAQGGE